jgi:hypothetical protein
MPIMASQGQSDARGAAHLLASMALAYMNCQEEGEDEDRRVVLNNAFRLLESYRTNVLFGSQATRMRRAESAKEKLALRRPAAKNVKEVREAMKDTLDSVFNGLQADEAIQKIEHVLRSIAYPATIQEKPDRQDCEQVARFFRELAKRLESA